MSKPPNWPAFATTHSNGVVNTPVIVCVIHALIRQYKHLLGGWKVRMPVKDAFESIEHAVRFADEFWTTNGRKRIRPNTKTVHILLIGGGYHFKLCVLHRHAAATRITYFDSMGSTPENTREIIQDFCTYRHKKHARFYPTKCDWQQDTVHCGIYVCAAVHSLLLQLCHDHTLGPAWTPHRFQHIHPLRLNSFANNANYVQKQLRPAYAKLLKKHMSYLLEKMPTDIDSIAPPFPPHGVRTMQRKIVTHDTSTIELLSD
tara:strand:+ start:95 stop:871 length:777 start_codon:yes stop_codon:yes gene_type:complete